MVTPTPLTARGWRGPVGEDPDVRNSAHIQLALGGARYRYYLVWITKLPPGMEFASIAELTLFRRPRRLYAAGARVAFDRQPAEAVEQLRVGDPGGLHQLRVHARRREAGHRVQLVHQHPLAVDEEVHSCEPLAAGVLECLQRELLHPLSRARGDPRGHLQLHAPRVYFAA